MDFSSQQVEAEGSANTLPRHTGNPYDLIHAISEDATRSPAAFTGLILGVALGCGR